MCGIVGIVGTQPVASRLVEALKRLEYRGYDSAGIATLVDGRIGEDKGYIVPSAEAGGNLFHVLSGKL